MTAIVTGRRCQMSVSTLMRLTKEKPQSPRNIELSQWMYRCHTGSSKPRLARRAIRTSGGTLGLVASSSKGSPGASASTVNSTTLMPSRLGIAMSRRRRT